MNPFRYLPRMFFTVTFMVALPMVFDMTTPDDHASQARCEQARAEDPDAPCQKESDLEVANHAMRDTLEAIKDIQ